METTIPKRRAAGVLVIPKDLSGVWMTQRLSGASGFVGGWQLPGGLAHAGESEEDAARRELLEESGLDVAEGVLWWCHRSEHPTESAHGPYSVDLFGFVTDQVPVNQEPTKAGAFQLIPIQQLLTGDMNLIPGVKAALPLLATWRWNLAEPPGECVPACPPLPLNVFRPVFSDEVWQIKDPRMQTALFFRKEEVTKPLIFDFAGWVKEADESHCVFHPVDKKGTDNFLWTVGGKLNCLFNWSRRIKQEGLMDQQSDPVQPPEAWDVFFKGEKENELIRRDGNIFFKEAQSEMPLRVSSVLIGWARRYGWRPVNCNFLGWYIKAQALKVDENAAKP